jgi:selenide,water dikinase
LVPPPNPNVLRSIEHLDDAGVYKISEDVAIIQTVDFITPIVNDPYSFGQIAAANSISDVYTMGGKPITAMNIVCFPKDKLDMSVLREILRGGLDKMTEAGVALMGGHSVNDPELKYGLSVTGTVHPDRLITNSGTQEGDILVLTKPLGTGVMSTALKNQLATEKDMEPVTNSMITLNKTAAEIMIKLGAHSCTDVTGFGLIGHASHLIQEGEIGLEIDFRSLPVFPLVNDFLEKGVYPGGLERNRDFYIPIVEFMGWGVFWYKKDILFDPQTSGGLLVALSPAAAKKMLDQLHKAGISDAVAIGRVVHDDQRKIIVK